MIRIPYGISNFERLIQDGYYFVDKTPFIERLENLDSSYNFMLRPRRFGKSLTISMLWYYYGVEHQEKFQRLFGNAYIGKNPTPRANTYRILYFEFSRIDTTTPESTFSGFLMNVKTDIMAFFNRYPIFSEEEKAFVLMQSNPAEMLLSFFSTYKKYADLPIYLLIDEYDHFSNEILAFNFSSFSEMVSRNGFVRKFYESIKTATGSNVVERLFVTGVTPITLDSLTSGFNIRTNLSRDSRFNEMMGFTDADVVAMLEGICEGRNCDIEEMMYNLRRWYNGYLFSKNATNRLFNPDMVLYFANHFKGHGTYPEHIISSNISSDYSKLRGLFNLKNPEENYKVLDDLVQGKELSMEITNEFSFEKEFTQEDFASLLYYMGYLTIKKPELTGVRLSVPNYVIWRLYLDFASFELEKRAGLSFEAWNIRQAMIDLAQEQKLMPVLEKLTETLKRISVRDAIKFDEKHLKMVFITLVNTANIYFIRSEVEVAKKYADVMLLTRLPILPNYQYAFEFKYLKKKEADKAPQALEEGKAQLKGYLSSEEWKKETNLKGYVVVYVYDELFAVEEV